MSALGDGFRKHPIALTIFGGFFACAAIAVIMEPFSNASGLPDALECEPATSTAAVKRGETLVHVSQPNVPATYMVCRPQ